MQATVWSFLQMVKAFTIFSLLSKLGFMGEVSMLAGKALEPHNPFNIFNNM